MILHSIISPADIFCNMDAQERSTEYKRIDGGILELENGCVRRLISTDPRLYLDARYQPYSKYNTDAARH